MMKPTINNLPSARPTTPAAADCRRCCLPAWLLSALLLSALLLPAGCIKEEVPADTASGEDGYWSVNVQMNVVTRAGTTTNLAPVTGTAPKETEIKTLRVYAYADNEQVGHFYASNYTAQDNVFRMQIRKNGNTNPQPILFYLIANEPEAGYSGDDGGSPFKNRMTKDDLDTIQFGSLNAQEHLPATLKKYVSVDFTREEIAESFELLHPVGKLSVQFRKAEGMAGTLTVTEIKVGNLLQHNYLMEGNFCEHVLTDPPFTENLLPNNSLEIAENNPASDSDGYVDAGISYYPFENKFGKDIAANPTGWWETPFNEATEGTGATLRVTYRIGTAAERQHTIYMPPIERNSWHNFRFTVNPNAVINLEYKVAGWTEQKIEYEFDHPDTTTSPMEEGDYNANAYWVDADNWDGAFSMKFEMTFPAGRECVVSLSNISFEYRILKDGQPLAEGQQITGGAGTYVIQVRPKQPLTDADQAKTVNLYVSLPDGDWLESDSRIMINSNFGTSSGHWPGAKEYITITEVPRPADETGN